MSQATCYWYDYFDFVKISRGKLIKYTTKPQAVMKQGKKNKKKQESRKGDLDYWCIIPLSTVFFLFHEGGGGFSVIDGGNWTETLTGLRSLTKFISL